MEIICPTCKNKCYICLDSYGRTPFHLHCNTCDINIGATSPDKCVELLKGHCKPNTYIEFYNNKINLLVEEGKRRKRMDKTTKLIIQTLENLRESVWVREDIESDYDRGYRAAEKDFIKEINDRIELLKEGK